MKVRKLYGFQLTLDILKFFPLFSDTDQDSSEEEFEPPGNDFDSSDDDYEPCENDFVSSSDESSSGKQEANVKVKTQGRKRLFQENINEKESLNASSQVGVSELEISAVVESENIHIPKKKQKLKVFPIRESTTRKRLRCPEKWKRSAAAIARQKGLGYTSQRGKQIPEKRPNFGVLCNETCRFKCSQSFDNEHRQKMFSAFYKIDVNAKNSFLFNCIRTKEVTRVRKGAKNHKSVSYEYKVMSDNKVIRVCKKALCELFQIGRKKVDILQKSIKSGNTVPSPDKRGKHANRPHKIPSEVEEFVLNHIRSFPSEESHYSRYKNIHKRYLSPLLSVRKMHELYIIKCREESKPSCFEIKECSYRKMFETKFNLSFGHPRSDTCSTCDEGKSNDEHIQNYKDAFALQTRDRKLAQTDNSVIYITVDLQQTMPLPRLTTSKAFYLRQMWFYNLGIHLITKNKEQGSFFTWTENTANRGSGEVASSMLTLFEFQGSIRQKQRLIVWSDSCAGQNKNFLIICLYQLFILKDFFKVIDHKFPEVGHSYLDSDRDFGRIEKKLRKHETIHLPEQYREVINKSSKKSFVTDMTSHFRSFDNLSTQLRLFNRKKNTLNEKIAFRDGIKWIRVERYGYYLYKDTYDEYTPFKEVCILKGKGDVKPDNIALPRIQNYGSISDEKLENLEVQVKYVPPEYRYYYENVIMEEKRKKNEGGSVKKNKKKK